ASNYRIERKAAGGSFGLIGTTASTSFTDSGTLGNAYLYRVCAADGSGNCASGYSNVALGAPLNFTTDPTITGYSESQSSATPIRAAHITELRTAVNAVRHLAGMGDGSWTHETLTFIYVEDVRDLREQLDPALLQLGIQPPVYTTDPTLIGFHENSSNATLIKAAHIRELRQHATSVIGSGGGGGGGVDIR